jgi:parvulin-like peptidyl-prolyl isomerase
MSDHEDDIEEHYDWEDELINEEEKNPANKARKEEKKQWKKNKKPEISNKKKEKKHKEKVRAVKEEEKEIEEEKEEEKEDNKIDEEAEEEFKLSKILVIIAIFAIIAISLFIVFKDDILPKDKKLIEGDTAAIINGEEISVNELNKLYVMSIPVELRSQIPKKDFLNQSLIPQILLRQKAEEKSIKVDEEEIEANIDDFLTRFGITRTQLYNEIKRDNIDIKDIKELYRTRILINKLIETEIESSFEVNEDEVRRHYENNIDIYSAKPGEIRVRHILVRSKEDADDIINRLERGEVFTEIARNNSVDRASARYGGDLGFFKKGVMVKEFEDIAFNLSVGEYTKTPVKTQFGYHIIKREPDVYPFDEVKDNIKQALIAAKRESILKTYLAQLISRADIKIFPVSNEIVIKREETEKQEREYSITTFEDTGDNICLEDGKPIIRLFSASIDSHSKWIKSAYSEVINEYKDDVIAYNWEIDTGDNLLTDKIENKLPKFEFEVYKKYNSKGTVPTFIFGCKYIRIGTGYEDKNDLKAEKKEFRNVIESLISRTNPKQLT